MKKFCQFLGSNPFLTSLSMGQNNLGDAGINYLANALKVNKGLVFLDLFDCEFSDEGAIKLAESLLMNTTLISLRIANTKVQPIPAQTLIK